MIFLLNLKKFAKVLVDDNENTLKCIYNFCYDILMADGIIVEAEQKLLDIAKKHFINEILFLILLCFL